VTAKAYAAAVLPRLELIVRDQLPAIERAGASVAESLAGGGRIWVAQTSHYLHHEATHRAGGFLGVHTFESSDEVRRGDSVLIGITAGAAGELVALTLDLQARSAAVVAITQREFEFQLEATHPSGRRLSDVADVHIDIGGPYGDGELELEAGGGAPIHILPSSGVTSLFVLWMILAEAVVRLDARGLAPLAYESNLLPGAPERNREREALYAATGRGVTAVPVVGPAR
jgi:uncharacterized phosphosugar-binding protein